MRHFHFLSLALLAVLTWATGSARAQVKLADFKNEAEGAYSDVSFSEVNEKAELKHGTLISLKLNDSTKVIGHLVRIDPKTNRLFLRIKPGEAPIAYNESSIQKLEKATRQVNPIVPAGFNGETWKNLPNGLQENNQGVIRIKPKTEALIKPAVDFGDEQVRARTENVVESEISKQVIYNGPYRTVVYHSNVISPGERDILEHLQKAENEYMALMHQKELQESLQDTLIAQQMALQQEKLETQKLINETLRIQNSYYYPYPSGPFVPLGNDKPGQPRVVIKVGSQTITPPVAVADRLPPLDPQSLSKAQEELRRVQSQAIFEEGQLIAVVAK